MMSDNKEFQKLLTDFLQDLLRTFPELAANLNADLQTVMVPESSVEDKATAAANVHAYCKAIYPQRFFDILYQNADLFKTAGDVFLLPGIDFALLWVEDISDNTRHTIWKYLQLILFTVVSTIEDGNSFGEAAKLFEAITEDEFKQKLEETMEQMQDLFQKQAADEGGSGEGSSGDDATTTDPSGINMPNVEELHDHVNQMMNGKLGRLAKEIAEETASELNMSFEDASSVNDVFKTLFKNPTRLMGLVKTIGDKLDTKLKSGDIKESELLAEASEMLQRMKDMPGMSNIQSMFQKMGMPVPPGMGGGGSGGAKVNFSAMQTQLDRNLRQAKQREGMLSRLAERQAAKANASGGTTTTTTTTTTATFTKGEHMARSTAADKPTESGGAAESKPKNKKNKNKHKK